jgi:hypothetical protein
MARGGVEPDYAPFVQFLDDVLALICPWGRQKSHIMGSLAGALVQAPANPVSC